MPGSAGNAPCCGVGPTNCDEAVKLMPSAIAARQMAGHLARFIMLATGWTALIICWQANVTDSHTSALVMLPPVGVPADGSV